jgi:hypothetical protein
MASKSYPLSIQPTDIALGGVQGLFKGKSFVASFDSTSQYAQGGSSACGLASLNAVRLVLESELKGIRGVQLLERMASRQFAEVLGSVLDRQPA